MRVSRACRVRCVCVARACRVLPVGCARRVRRPALCVRGCACGARRVRPVLACTGKERRRWELGDVVRDRKNQRKK